MAIPVTAALTAVLGLLLVLLAGNVSRQRIGNKVSLGDGGNKAVERAIRAHGNAAEHVPIYLLLSLCYELVAGSGALLVVLGGLFVASRLAHAAGMLGRGLHLARQAGAGVTALCQLALALALGGQLIA